MTRLRHIALVGGLEYAVVREILHGVQRHAHRDKPWVFRHYRTRDGRCDVIPPWRPDGIVAQVNDGDLARDLASLGVPVVNISNVLRDPPFPTVSVDNAAVGRLAADHFLGRGFRSFGYVPLANCHFSVEREAAFAETLAAARLAYSVSPAAVGDKVVSPAVIEWLRSLAKPAAVFVCTDWLAVQVSECCREGGIGVPDPVALLGVSDDSFLCQMTWPPLSSIRAPNATIGAEAARLLAGLMDGGAAPDRRVLIPPSLVVARGSTDVHAATEPIVAEALAFMEANASRDIRVTDVLDRVLVSRRRLEQVFLAALGRTPLDQINRMHCQVARQLLVETDRPMDDVARGSGFSGPERMAKVFRRVVGSSPIAFRRLHRA
ncbi:MAG TPA: substrate-binding domain-containing protein [Tepidisphaeraceae bacterium]|nr:substrate-binding domain-containing protein [Tepidisphaeraceae bacterium]